jgi:hypothetical protein
MSVEIVAGLATAGVVGGVGADFAAAIGDRPEDCVVRGGANLDVASSSLGDGEVS